MTVQAQTLMTAPGPGKPFMLFMSGGGGGFPPPPLIPPLMMAMRAAHLTADQQKKIGEIVQSNHAQLRPLLEQLQTVHEKIADRLLSAGEVSAADLAPLESQAAKLDAQIQQRTLDSSVQIRALLTSDQLARMAQFHQKMAALQEQMKTLMNEAAQQSDPNP